MLKKLVVSLFRIITEKMMKAEDIFRKRFKNDKGEIIKFKVGKNDDFVRIFNDGKEVYNCELCMSKVKAKKRITILTPNHETYWLDYDGESFIEYYKPDGSDFQKLKLID